MNDSDTDDVILLVEKMLKSHDWGYQYSDDYTVFCRGADSWDRISELLKQLPKEEVDRLLAPYRRK